MQNDILKLTDKTAVIVGPVTSYLFDLASSLSRQGAAIVLLTPDATGGQRLCQIINDEQEIKAEYGRAAVMALPDKAAPEKIIADVSHVFHGLDIYIDNRGWYESIPAIEDADFNERLKNHMQLSTQLAQAAATFLKTRKKGKMIFLLEGTALDHDKIPSFKISRSELLDFIEAQAMEMKKSQSIANAIILNFTEDFLLKHWPKQSLKESLSELKKADANFDITRTEAISKLVTFLASDLAQGVTGQAFKLNA